MPLVYHSLFGPSPELPWKGDRDRAGAAGPGRARSGREVAAALCCRRTSPRGSLPKSHRKTPAALGQGRAISCSPRAPHCSGPEATLR